VINKKKGVNTKKGFIFDIIEKANAHKEDKMPYIVILDEMNRVDVSRVFGELFTAIEKRDTDVFLTLPDPIDSKKRLILNVPDNIYFIGTMNEIDFSLEQLDFALRRRFIWELVDYNEDTLETIIRHKIEKIEVKDKAKENDNVTSFLNNCTEVNKYIANSLGKEYHIGHAFFAEIAKLYKNLIENKIPGNNWNQAQKMLWQMSILPTIEAYCGSMDREEKKKFVNECSSRYYRK
jgi:5-methylcytosine-specific restriction protein B